MIRGRRRLVPDTVCAPVVVHALNEPEYLSMDEALQFLSKFIEEREAATLLEISSDMNNIEATSGGVSNDSTHDSVLSNVLAQLRRIQRDFKGLPPTILQDSEEAQSRGSVYKKDCE